MPRHAVLVGVAILFAAAGTGAAPAATHEGRTKVATYAHQASTATNAHRSRHDLRPLGQKRCLRRAAARQARAMAKADMLFHQDLRRVLRDCRLHRAGENVAFGYATGRDAVNLGWMQSKEHRHHILSSSYALMGIAARKGPDGRWYVAQVLGASR